MNKHKIVLVHGMGDFAKDWSEVYQKQIRENYDKVRSVYTIDFDERFEFVEINYNKFFEERREQWKGQRDELKNALVSGGISSSIFNKLIALSDKLTSDRFESTHVLDVVLYRYVKQISEQIRSYLATEFIEAAKSLGGWTIVAHSLGTSVTHDSLHALFTHQIEGKTLDREFRPANLWMIANVSRIVADDVDVYKSVVKPTFDPDNGVASEYFNAQHPFDPIPNVRAFHSNKGEAQQWRNEVGNRYQHILISPKHVAELNVHDLDHYLDCPEVVRAIALCLGGAAGVDTQKMQQYKADFESNTVEGKARSVKKKFEQISLGDPSTFEAFLKTTAEFKDWIKKFMSEDL